MHATLPLMRQYRFPALSRGRLETLQVNLGYKCNQSCVHCHVNAGPSRTEMMSPDTISEVRRFLSEQTPKTLDITGGAPELHPQFRELVYEISQYLFYEATRDVQVRVVPVETPLVTADGRELADRVGIVPVLRAGLGMANAMLDALPEASVWHVGMARDHATWEPKTYYRNLPPGEKVDVLLILDPMLATGGSAVETIALLKAEGNKRIKFVGLIGAPEGVKRLGERLVMVLPWISTFLAPEFTSMPTERVLIVLFVMVRLSPPVSPIEMPPVSWLLSTVM